MRRLAVSVLALFAFVAIFFQATAASAASAHNTGTHASKHAVKHTAKSHAPKARAHVAKSAKPMMKTTSGHAAPGRKHGSVAKAKKPAHRKHPHHGAKKH